MKKKALFSTILILSFLILVLGCTGGEASDNSAMSISDSNLENAFREILEKPSGDIYPSDFEGITELDLSEKEIKDISPLSRLKNITSIYLNNNMISDLSPLSNMDSLQVLIVSGNEISDLTPLSKLNHIEMLVLGHNRIEDLSPLSKLNTLNLLSLNDNMISDISSLSALNLLEVLDLRNNKLTDINSLTNLNNMNILKFSYNRVVDIGPLQKMYDTGAFQQDNNFIGLTYNSMQIRPDTDNRKVVEYLIEQGVDVDWKEGNFTDKPKEDIG